MSHGIPIQNTGNQGVCTHLTLISQPVSLSLPGLTVSPNISALPLSHYTRIYTSVGFTGDRAPISLPFSHHHRSTMSSVSRLLLPWSPFSLLWSLSLMLGANARPATTADLLLRYKMTKNWKLWCGQVKSVIILFSSPSQFQSATQSSHSISSNSLPMIGPQRRSTGWHGQIHE